VRPAQAAHVGEHPWEKARRLARELSETLDEIAETDKTTDRMVAIVEPASKGEYAIGFMDREFYYTAVGARGLNKHPRDLISYHRAGMELAARQLDPQVGSLGTIWDVDTGKFCGVAVSYRRA
jgi:hypothetical protein